MRVRLFIAIIATLGASSIAAGSAYGAPVVADYPEAFTSQDVTHRLDATVVDVRDAPRTVANAGPDLPPVTLAHQLVTYRDRRTGKNVQTDHYPAANNPTPDVGDREVVLLTTLRGHRFPVAGPNSRFRVDKAGRAQALGRGPFAERNDGRSASEVVADDPAPNGQGSMYPDAPADLWNADEGCDPAYAHAGFCHTATLGDEWHSILIFQWLDGQVDQYGQLWHAIGFPQRFSAAVADWDQKTYFALTTPTSDVNRAAVIAVDAIVWDSAMARTYGKYPHGTPADRTTIIFNLVQIAYVAGQPPNSSWYRTADGNQRVACHEYGHAVGLAHDAASSGCMGTFLLNGTEYSPTGPTAFTANGQQAWTVSIANALAGH